MPDPIPPRNSAMAVAASALQAQQSRCLCLELPHPHIARVARGRVQLAFHERQEGQLQWDVVTAGFSDDQGQ